MGVLMKEAYEVARLKRILSSNDLSNEAAK
jgi:hypothetical protein